MLAGELGLIDLASTIIHPLLLHFCAFPRLQVPVLIRGVSLSVQIDVDILRLRGLTVEHGVGSSLALALLYRLGGNMVIGRILVKRTACAQSANLHSLVGNEWRHGGR